MGPGARKRPDLSHEPAAHGARVLGHEAPFGTPSAAAWELYRGANLANERFYGNAVLLFRKDSQGALWHNRVLAIAGGVPGQACQAPPSKVQAPYGCNGPDCQHGSREPLLSRRVYSNAIVLPDGTILVVGGNRKNHGSSVQPTPVGDPEFRPELYDPTDDPALPGSTRYLAASNQVSSSTWPAPFTIGPTSSLPRLYHSMAMLLPDASVFVVGGRIWLNDPPGLPQIYPDSRLSGEIFYPPYLFEGNQFAARPTIDGMTLSNVSNQALSTSTLQTFPVDVTTIVGTVKKVTLARPAAVTTDSDQRYIELEFTGGTLPGQSQQITVTAPSEDIAPPGFYMLFVLEDRAGRLVPSIATFVQFL